MSWAAFARPVAPAAPAVPLAAALPLPEPQAPEVEFLLCLFSVDDMSALRVGEGAMQKEYRFGNTKQD